MMVTQTRRMTAEELLERSGELGPCELVRGELIRMTPAGADHGDITMRLALSIGNHVREHRLGKVYSAETGFVLERDPDTVREADVPFVRADRVPKGPTPGFFEGPPDLAVEVLSPNDRATNVAEKVEAWLTAGCRMVWVVDPRRQTVAVHRDPKRSAVLHREDTLDGEDVLPGFRIPVRQVFEGTG